MRGLSRGGRNWLSMFCITFCRLLACTIVYLVAGIVLILIFSVFMCIIGSIKELCLKGGLGVLPQNFFSSIHTKWCHFMQ